MEVINNINNIDNMDVIDNMEDMEPMKKPKNIKIDNIVYVKYLDNLFTSKWKQDYFQDKMPGHNTDNNLLTQINIPYIKLKLNERT